MALELAEALSHINRNTKKSDLSAQPESQNCNFEITFTNLQMLPAGISISKAVVW